MGELWGEYLSVWKGYRIEVDEYCELDGERVLAFTRRSGRGQTSGLEVAQVAAKGASLWHVRDGIVVIPRGTTIPHGMRIPS